MSPNTSLATIAWPAFIHLEGDAELMPINDPMGLAESCNGLIVTQEDELVDSEGQRFVLADLQSHNQSLVTGRYTLAQIEQLLQQHQSALNQSCALKTVFPSIAAAVAALSNN